MRAFVLVILLLGNLVNGQEGSQETLDQKSLYTSDYAYQPEVLGTRIIGSPYVDIKYKIGLIYQDGVEIMEAPMRYNANKEVIEYIGEGNTKNELPRQRNFYASIDGTEYRVLEFYEQGEKKLGYMNPLMKEGEFKLYFRPYKEILKEDSSPMVRRNYAYCLDASSYYIKKKEMPAVKTELTKEQITSKLPGHSDKLEQYIKGFKLDLRKEADVIRVLEFYNSLTP